MKKLNALPVLLIALALVACGGDWSVGPNDGGASLNRSFRYYYGVDCRYDSFGSYDCTDYYSLSPSVGVRLQVTRDGYVTLCVDSDCSYYDPGEYDVGYDHGDRYYDFVGDDVRMTVYEDGSEMVYIDGYEGMAYYYYHDYDYYY